MRKLSPILLILFAFLLTAAHPGPGTDLNGEGLAALLHCESTTNHAVNSGNGYYGGVQWLPATWNAAAAGAGWDTEVGVRPDLVASYIQDDVTIYWWSASDPHTQWPACHGRAIEAMGGTAARTPPPASELPVEHDRPQLALTGVSSVPLALSGLLLIAVGSGAMIVVGRR